jgi:hypothetical protein
MLEDEHFQRILTLERQRSQRSQMPFLLMLLDTGDFTPSEKNRQLLEKTLEALAGSIRDTDVAGWYTNDSILGVMCTEFGSHGRNTIQSAMMTRVSETLRNNLSAQQFSEMCISFYLFPEDLNHDLPRQPTDPDAPIYAPRKPRPHLRSGGATAVPEPDGAQQVSSDNSFIRGSRSSVEDSHHQGNAE